MRLRKEEIITLKENLFKFIKDGKMYLFGSRVDDSKKGGDIDLLIVSSTATKKDIRKFRIEFFKKFGEQKFDIVLDDGSFSNPFTKHILKKAILL
ncbi:MAG: nucleotidyltransferase domain-containing protein [Arcobacter sp.]|nr:nucleotidyltransferase domain-containing protein [Arcobacter sp.]